MEKQSPNFEIEPNLSEDFPVLNSILSRRNVRQFESQPIDKKTIHKLLYAASWAPNHKLTEPWRFVVISPESQSRFVDTYCTGMLNMALQQDPNAQEDPILQEKITKVREDFAKVPLFIAAASAKHENPILGFENRITTACALQNMLLAAQEIGIYAHWGSGKGTKTPEVQEFLGFSEEETFMGLFHMGYATPQGRMKRTPVEEFIRWV